MTNEEVKPHGDATLVSIELDGMWRRITITRDAIEEHLHLSPKVAAAMTEEERCEFVRSHMPYVFATVRRKIRRSETARHIIIRTGEL